MELTKSNKEALCEAQEWDNVLRIRTYTDHFKRDFTFSEFSESFPRFSGGIFKDSLNSWEFTEDSEEFRMIFEDLEESRYSPMSNCR